jgi:ABC-2 type transport system permease protein
VRRIGSHRALSALLRVGLLEQVAYRAQIVIWVLATTTPLVMLALFGAVARDGPVEGYDGPRFVAYFLATFIVRQLVSSWAAWPISQEIRDGTMATRLLRPVHPLWGYAADQIASIPARLIVSLPVAVILIAVVGSRDLASDAVTWSLFGVSLAGAWLLSTFVSVAIGGLAFFIESSTKVMEIWLAGFFVFSGYLVPVDLFPPWMRGAIDELPFRYQIGLPVELMMGAHSRAQSLVLLERQWMWVALAAGVTFVVWRRGLGRFAAFGG